MGKTKKPDLDLVSCVRILMYGDCDMEAQIKELAELLAKIDGVPAALESNKLLSAYQMLVRSKETSSALGKRNQKPAQFSRCCQRSSQFR